MVELDIKHYLMKYLDLLDYEKLFNATTPNQELKEMFEVSLSEIREAQQRS